MSDTKKNGRLSNNCIADQLARMEQLQKTTKNPLVLETVHGLKETVRVDGFAMYEPRPRRADLYDLIEKVVRWHYDRNLIEGSSDKDQVLKLAQELGELSDSVCKGKDIRDDIGDMLVVMINIAERNGVLLSECLNKAWNDIKHRKGKMKDGIFVKEADL
jgi:NTP pyrophosphatase (non-canonical NTP hydrolase)